MPKKIDEIKMTSLELCQKMADLTGSDVILMFSRGKDSICSFYQLKQFFKNVHLVHYFRIPGMRFEEEQLKYFEDKFGQKIHNMPHPVIFKQLNNYTFQSPDHAEIIQQFGLPTHNRQNFEKLLPIDLGCSKAWHATGVRSFETLARQMMTKMHGVINTTAKRFYPIFDWLHEDVRDCLNKHNIKLPVDYQIWGKSFDGLHYRFIKGLKDNFPEDFEIAKQFFPLLEVEILRYDSI